MPRRRPRPSSEPSTPPEPSTLPEPSPRRASALMAAGGLAGVLASFALVSVAGSSESPKLMILILLAWIFFAVGLYGLVVGERAERGFFRALRLVFVPVFAFVGTFATIMLATKR